MDRIVPCLAIPPLILFGFNSFGLRVHGKLPSPRTGRKTCNFGLSFVPRGGFIERSGPSLLPAFHDGRSYKSQEQVGFQTRKMGRLASLSRKSPRSRATMTLPPGCRSRAIHEPEPTSFSSILISAVGPSDPRQHMGAKSPLRRIAVTRRSRRRPSGQL